LVTKVQNNLEIKESLEEKMHKIFVN